MTDSIYLHQEVPELAFIYEKLAGQPGPEELA